MKKIIFILGLLLIAFSNPTQAATWDFYENIKGINYVGGDEILVIDYANLDANDIYRIYSFDPYSDASALRLYNCPTDIDHVTELSDGRLVFVTHTGEVWLIDSLGLFDWGNRTVGEDCYLLTDQGTPSSAIYEYQIYVDGADNLYLIAPYDVDTVYQLSVPFYSVSTFYADTPSRYFGGGIGQNGIYWNDRYTTKGIYLITEQNTRSLIHDYDIDGTATYPIHTVEDSNGNLYELWRKEDSSTAAGYIKHYNTTDSTLTDLYTTNAGPTGIVLTDQGDIFASNDDGIITSYTTIDGAVGFAPFEQEEEEPETPTSTGPSVNWDSNYVLDDVGSYTWNVDSENWADDSYIYKCIVSRVSDNGQYDQQVHDSGELTSQTGSQDIIFDTATSYKVQLKKYSKADLYIGIIFQPDILATDTITITAGGQSQINAPASAQKGQAFNISYNYGYTPQDPEIRIKKLEGIQYNIISKIATTASPEAGTTYTTQGTIYETGYYVVELYDAAKGSQATDSIQIIYTYVPPENPINDNFINAKKDSYALGEYCRGSYAIDDTNFTAYDVRLEVYNTDKSIIAFSVPAVQQLNTFDVGLFDYHLYDDGEELHPVNTNFMSGPHDVRLTGYYSNGTQALIIDSDSFTITDVTTEGYGLILSKGEVDQEEQFTISAVSPTEANVKMLDSMDRPIKTWAINGSMDIPFKLSVPGTYQIQLLTTSGELKANQLLTVRDNGISVNTGTESGGNEAIYNNFLAFFLKPMFWGLILFIGIVGSMAQSKHINGQSVGIVAFLLVQLFAIVGLWAPYTMYVVVSSWIIAGIFFSVGRNMAKGEV